MKSTLELTIKRRAFFYIGMLLCLVLSPSIIGIIALIIRHYDSGLVLGVAGVLNPAFATLFILGIIISVIYSAQMGAINQKHEVTRYIALTGVSRAKNTLIRLGTTILIQAVLIVLAIALACGLFLLTGGDISDFGKTAVFPTKDFLAWGFSLTLWMVIGFSISLIVGSAGIGMMVILGYSLMIEPLLQVLPFIGEKFMVIAQGPNIEKIFSDVTPTSEVVQSLLILTAWMIIPLAIAIFRDLKREL